MSVKKLRVNADNEGRRIDNYLLSIYKSVPKSKIYKIIRKGEVRVNSSRIKAHYKLCINDLIRIPPNLDTSETIKKIIEKKDIKNHISTCRKHKYKNTINKIHKYTNTAHDERPKRLNMWYIFEKRIVQGY